MDFFKINKYQSKYENVLFVAKVAYESIDKPMTIDGIFQSLAKQLPMEITPDVESIIMMSISFLYSLDLVSIEDSNIKRSESE